jgi:N-acetylglucosamine malate deacetylase 1
VTRVLVVGAHPDDETVGCGGALRLHALDGDELRAVFLTSGEGGGHGIAEPGETREAEAREAARIIGIAQLEFWHEPDGALRASEALVGRLADLIDRWRPRLVYAPHRRDQHRDHRAAAEIARRAVADAGAISRLLTYEIWTPVSRMVHTVDITDVLEDKLRAIRAYRSQCAVMRFDDAFAGLARYRGEMHSWPGGPYAEVFGRS